MTEIPKPPAVPEEARPTVPVEAEPSKWAKVWAWLKANVWAIVVALVAALGAGIFWSYHRGKVRSLEDQKAIEEAHRKVAALDARREVLAEQSVENAAAIEAVQTERADLQRQAVALDAEVADMSDEDVEAAFRALY